MSVLHISKENFTAAVLSSDKPVLVDFWAPWCGPCRMMGPVVDALAKELPSVTVGKINIDEEPELAQAYGVMTIPTLAVFEGGKMVRHAVGVRPKQAVAELVRG